MSFKTLSQLIQLGRCDFTSDLWPEIDVKQWQLPELMADRGSKSQRLEIFLSCLYLYTFNYEMRREINLLIEN
jgi:hypothetical protein